MKYVLLGGQVVPTVRVGGGQWCAPEGKVRRAAAELNAVGMDRQDLVRIGPFRGAPPQECDEETPLRDTVPGPFGRTPHGVLGGAGGTGEIGEIGEIGEMVPEGAKVVVLRARAG
ncbi:hypothetical protein ACFY6U_28955 [Streptomyces sp. NPDC013157]|uniref:hypothetical protein n=1 Tax=Streptomyces sp. NPDC013157 TaxID=3364861 RepID=UPI0036B26360